MWCFPAQAPSDSMAAGTGVILTVTALDAKGDPVADLTAADFRVSDDGKEKPVLAFHSPSEKPAAETPPAVTVILYDLLNSGYSHHDYDFTYIDRALEPLEVADHVYLYFLTNHGVIYPIHGFPSPDQMAFHPAARAVASDPPAATAPWTKQIRALLDDGIQKVYGFRTVDYADPGYRAATTFAALTMLQNAFEGFPGAKTIVWITSGAPNRPSYPHGCKDFPITDTAGSYVAGKCTDVCMGLSKCIDYMPFLQRFTSTLEQSNTVMDIAEDLPIGAMPSTARGTSADTLHQLANLNGGLFVDGSNIDKAITGALKDSRGRYQIKIEGAALDGKYHKFKVSCARKGVRLEAPKGYWAAEP